MQKKLIAVLAAALLASCSSYYSEPYSLVGAQKWNMTNPNTFNITLSQIDGSSPLNQPAKITPGKHTLTVNLGNAVTNVTMDFKPCTQYWIVGERLDPAGQNLVVKVDNTEPIPGCKMPAAK